MELLLYVVGILRKLAWAHPTTEENRTKLQKKRRRDHKVKSNYSREMLDVVRKSTLGLCLQNEALGHVTSHLTSTESHLRLLENRASSLSISSASLYSIDLMQQKPHPRRTRPKTPILRVGQREALAEQVDGTASQLAQDYQALLPPQRPSHLLITHQPALRRLRKVKSQISLRDLSRDQAEGKTCMPDSDGEVETLVGSEPTSPDTAHHPLWTARSFTKKPSCASIKSAKNVKDDADIGLKICVDLLTNELASILFRHHPIENSDRASELQILLMIEAYETIQKQIHEERMKSRVTAQRIKQLEQLLENWLDVLYDLYDRSQQNKNDDVEYVEADLWVSPPPVHLPQADVRA